MALAPRNPPTEAISAPTPPDLRLTGSLRPHPAAALLPEIDKDGFAGLLTDIREHGIEDALAINHEDVVLDGHLRLRVAQRLGFETVPVRIVAPADETEYVLRSGLHRRHLTKSQLAALVLELEQYRQTRTEAERRRLANLKGQPALEGAELPPRGKTRDRAAAWAGVSARTIQSAATVKAADPELFEQIKQGRIPADRAARQVLQKQRDSQLVSPPLPAGLFDLVYADPPWPLPGSPDGSRSIQNHYPVMPLAEIAAMQVPASPDAICLIWAVSSMLPEALEVLAAWGFQYKTNLVWTKDRVGLGAWARNAHELLLVGTRGAFKPPEPNHRVSSVIVAPRGRHFAKPDSLYPLIERMYPGASRLELFGRGKARRGWTSWGHHAENDQEPE